MNVEPVAFGGMSDRPGSGGPGDGPEFGWLYGQRPGGSGDDEATRRLPVQPRPGSSAGPPTENLGRPSVGPRPPSPQPPPYQQPPRSPQQPQVPAPPQRQRGGFWSRRLRNPFFYVRALLALLLIWVLFVVAVPFITWQSADKVAWEPKGERPGDQDGTTYLLVGSDSRKDLSAKERKELATGNPSSELTDTMMLLHTGSGPSVLLSIPRDTQIEREFYSGKINGAYAQGGAPMLTRVIEAETGVRVDEYVEIGLGGVVDVVDAVGGITINPKERLKDPLAGLDVRRGEQEVDGRTALAYSRSRKQSALGDLERVRRQREVIGAIGDKVLSPWSVINPVRWWRLNDAVPSFFRFGEGTSAIDASRWALAMSRTSSGGNRTCTMPVTSGSAEEWDRERADPLLQAIADDETDRITNEQCTPNGVRP